MCLIMICWYHAFYTDCSYIFVKFNILKQTRIRKQNLISNIFVKKIILKSTILKFLITKIILFYQYFFLYHMCWHNLLFIDFY